MRDITDEVKNLSLAAQQPPTSALNRSITIYTAVSLAIISKWSDTYSYAVEM